MRNQSMLTGSRLSGFGLLSVLFFGATSVSAQQTYYSPSAGGYVTGGQVIREYPSASTTLNGGYLQQGSENNGGGQLDQMLQLHNNVRSRYGMRPMNMNSQLNDAAQRFADFVARTRSFNHYADGRSPADRMAASGYRHSSWAENLAWTGGDANGAMNTWMNSGGHRANVLSNHSDVGFGVSGNVWVAVYGNSPYSGGSVSYGTVAAAPSTVYRTNSQVTTAPTQSSIPLAPGERIISERIVSERVISR